jgi:hypothetical protein
MSMKLTQQDVWLSSGLFAALAVVSGSLLAVFYEPNLFSRSSWVVTVSSAIFWGTLAVFMAYRFWDEYYRYFYPTWMKSLLPVSILLYSAVGYALWAISSRAGSPAIAVFLLLGGAAGVLEHAFAIEVLEVLEKVPMLQGLTAGPVLLFSFVEYSLYWSLVGWLSLAAAVIAL